MIYVTSGADYTDIDGLACAIAYSSLLRLEGKDSSALLFGDFNQSITPTVSSWDYQYKTKISDKKANFVVVDISNSEIITHTIDKRKIIEIYDHHTGFEDYWKNELGNKAKIDYIGACATLIWEEYEKRGCVGKISNLDANLLYTAISSNTLNFKATITTDRDRKAFSKLEKFTKLPTDWIRKYYQEIDDLVLADPEKALIGDAQVGELPNTNIVWTAGQLELWNSYDFISKNQALIKKTLLSFGNSEWVLTSPSIGEGINYIYTDSKYFKRLFEKYFDTHFDGDIGKTQKLWLRKEIRQRLSSL